MLKPPCNCKPSNVNNTTFAKGNHALYTGPGLQGEQQRPPIQAALTGPTVNIFRQAPPSHVLTWTSSKSRSNPVIQATPRKSTDPKLTKVQVRMKA